MTSTVEQILDTIRDNASTQYATRVPSATQTSIAEVGKAITMDGDTSNEFVSALLNRIALTIIKSKSFKNPLARLKKPNQPYGSHIQEIFINPATDVGYQKDGARLLQTTAPDGKACYYGMNRQGEYPISINEEQLSTAFTNSDTFTSFYNGIVTSMYSGDEIDEFLLMKNMIGKAIDNGAIQVINVSASTPKELSKSISAISKAYQFPSTQFCGYNRVNELTEESSEKECITYCRPDEQVLLITASAQNEIDYEVLATMFHMEVAKLQAITILVDEIPSTKYNIDAMLCDTAAIQVRDKVYKITDMYNGSNLVWNAWLHHWQFMFVSMFANCCAFGTEIVSDTE